MTDTEHATDPATPDDLFARLDALGIAHATRHHPPVFTVGEAKELRGQIPGGHTKNLFLKTKKKGALYLVVTLEHRAVDLKALSKALGAQRFSFGSADLLRTTLGVEPGSVTPFSLINDREHAVTVVLDEAMLAIDPLNFHPLKNTMTTAVNPEGLLAFVRGCGHTPVILDLEAL
jgi:Ala-tRNA(Pro) deacylase